jgi:hypothetical protein
MYKMGQILDASVRFFESDEWPVTQVEDQPLLITGFQGENGQFSCFARVREEQSQLLFYSVCPVNVPQDKRLLVAEFLTRANYGLHIGNFELDFGDGEVRYKTSIDVEGDRLVPALVQQVAYANVLTMDAYLPGILRVIYGDSSPADAIAAIEE